jgi:hypothetical protein
MIIILLGNYFYVLDILDYEFYTKLFHLNKYFLSLLKYNSLIYTNDCNQ